MLTSRKTTLKPLLESAEGIHLTAYFVNQGDILDLKAQLRNTINQAKEWLNPAMAEDERAKFLEPLESLLVDARIFKKMKGNVGLFRNQNLFRLLNVPIRVEPTCQVATSFHVKPLLKWLQTDQEFLLLGLEKSWAHLYLGSQNSLKLVDSVIFPEAMRNDSSEGYMSLKDLRLKANKEDETFMWLNQWIEELTKNSKPKLFVAGEKSIATKMARRLRYNNAVKTPIAYHFSPHRVSDICSPIRKMMKAEARGYLERSLLEFRLAEGSHRLKKNIFQIAKAVVQGRVRRLLVTDELSIFGKICKKSGGVSIHPCDLDHEDDDLLDDLAQMVLSQGGDVIVASKNEMPKGRAILAILEDDEKDISHSKIRTIDQFVSLIPTYP